MWKALAGQYHFIIKYRSLGKKEGRKVFILAFQMK
jgi:hypothetical protein